MLLLYVTAYSSIPLRYCNGPLRLSPFPLVLSLHSMVPFASSLHVSHILLDLLLFHYMVSLLSWLILHHCWFLRIPWSSHSLSPSSVILVTNASSPQLLATSHYCIITSRCCFPAPYTLYDTNSTNLLPTTPGLVELSRHLYLLLHPHSSFTALQVIPTSYLGYLVLVELFHHHGFGFILSHSTVLLLSSRLLSFP
jgi:hypothetical protein